MPRPRRALCFLLLALAPLACRGSRPPDLLLLISVDTLRADHLGAHGSALGATPNLDQLAAESIVFSAGYAPASHTLPSLSSLMTGRYPEEIGVRNNEGAVAASVPTLAAALRQAGWRTQAAVRPIPERSGAGGFLVELRELGAVLAGCQQRLSGCEGARLEPAEPSHEIIGPARLAELAVVHDIHADLGLPPHDVLHRALEGGGIARLVGSTSL